VELRPLCDDAAMIEAVRMRERGALDWHSLLRRLQHTGHNVKQSVIIGEKCCRFVTYKQGDTAALGVHPVVAGSAGDVAGER
jgi:hypothetical protein